MKRTLVFAAIALALTSGAALLMAQFWTTAADTRAIWTSAGVAFVVQMLAFVIATTMTRDQAMIGWGLGALLRLITLAVYALVFVNALALPATAALVSLATFFFLSTLVEPLVLAR